MAKLIKTDGTTENVKPANGKDFTLEELQHYVDGYVQFIYPMGKIMVLNEDGKFIGKEYNEEATEIAHGARAIFPGDCIVGDVLLCEQNEIK